VGGNELRRWPRRRKNRSDAMKFLNATFCLGDYSRACSSAERIGPYKAIEIRGHPPFMLEPRLAELGCVTAVLAEMPNGGARNGVGVTLDASTTDEACRCAFLFCTQIQLR
jgi:hypothetical protein